jgi:spermidine/putrescine-binding protein
MQRIILRYANDDRALTTCLEEKNMNLRGLFLLLYLLAGSASAAERKVVNIYTWANEIPDTVVRQFEKETGIKVNLSTYANNEVMFAKLRAVKNAGYDIVLPSSYFVDRMRQNMLVKQIKANYLILKHRSTLRADYDRRTVRRPHVMASPVYSSTKIFLSKVSNNGLICGTNVLTTNFYC